MTENAEMARRRSYLALAALAHVVAVAAACDAFESEETSPPSADAGPSPDASTSDARPPIDAGDGGSSVPCEPELLWVDESAVADGGLATATCGGVAGVDLLNSDSHCGRCGHSCLGDGCEKGRCKPKLMAAAESGTGLRVHAGSLAYVNGDFVRVLSPPAASTTIATAPGASGLRSAVYDDAHVFTRGNLRLFRVGRDGGAPDTLSAATAGIAPVFLSPTGDVVFDSDNGYLRASKLGDGGDVVPFGPRNVTAAAEVPGGLVLLANAWNDGVLSRLGVLHHEAWAGGTTLTLGSATNLTAVAVDAEHVYAIRVDGAATGIVRARLPPKNDGVVQDFAVDPATASPGQRYIAVDATHVYWTRPVGGSVDIVKRAKCGGETVVIAKGAARGLLVPFGDYLYQGAFGVPRIAK